MRQITPKKLFVPSDVTESSILDSIDKIYNPRFERPLEDTRFIIFVSSAFNATALIQSDVLRKLNIEFVIAEDALNTDGFIIYCPDTGSCLTCGGA